MLDEVSLVPKLLFAPGAVVPLLFPAEVALVLLERILPTVLLPAGVALELQAPVDLGVPSPSVLVKVARGLRAEIAIGTGVCGLAAAT